MMTAIQLRAALKRSGTPEATLERFEALLPGATAKDAIDMLEAARATEGTLKKACGILASFEHGDAIEGLDDDETHAETEKAERIKARASKHRKPTPAVEAKE